MRSGTIFRKLKIVLYAWIFHSLLVYESKWEGTLDRISLRCITLLSSKKKKNSWFWLHIAPRTLCSQFWHLSITRQCNTTQQRYGHTTSPMYQKQLWGTAVALETYKAGEATLRSLINGYAWKTGRVGRFLLSLLLIIYLHSFQIT